MTEGPYKLPAGWRWVRLGEVCEIIMGQSPPGKTYNTKRRGLPFFQGKADFGELHPTPRVWCSAPKKIAEAGDILISVRAPVGPTNIAREKCCIGRGLAALRPGENLHPLWLLFYLRSIEGTLANEGSGSTFNAITKQELQNLPIPLPPLEEQRRIVARVEELMARVREARRLRKEALEDAERLWQAVLAQTFPKPGQELPEGWRWVRLGEVCEHKTGIWGPEAQDPSQGFPVVRSTEIDGLYINPQTASIRVVPLEKVKAYKLVTGDILVNKSSGSPHLVGWPAIFNDPHDGKIYLFSNFMLRLRVNKSSLEPWFLLYYLHSPIARKIYLNAQDTTSGLRNLRVREFMAQPIPLPPLPEQRRIVAHLEAVQERVRALKEAQAAVEAELKRLEQAILDKAFRGEL